MIESEILYENRHTIFLLYILFLLEKKFTLRTYDTKIIGEISINE